MSVTLLPNTAPVTASVRAYFAPVDRVNNIIPPFDAAQQGRFDLNTPPAGWFDAGRIVDFAPLSETEVQALRSGSPALPRLQIRTQRGATVECTFTQWGKLQLALHSGTQHFNLLASDDAFSITITSTANTLQINGAHNIVAGDAIVVDADYVGETGYIGSGISGSYISDPTVVATDVNYTRHVSFNVASVIDVSGSTVTLASPLPAGPPTVAMKVSRVAGFTSREGGNYFQEWSALFVAEGAQSDRILFHYPRLQTIAGTHEQKTLRGPFTRWLLNTRLRALPVADAHDGESTFCYCSYLPAPMREV